MNVEIKATFKGVHPKHAERLKEMVRGDLEGYPARIKLDGVEITYDKPKLHGASGSKKSRGRAKAAVAGKSEGK